MITSVSELINAKYPGLSESIKETIENSESEYNGDTGDSHLWEHTLNVASIALRLAQKEKTDPLPVVLSALLHDTGKFSGGEYHKEEIPEESQSAEIAETILKEFKVPVEISEMVINALRSLYMAGSVKSKISDIIHDADFLSKSGPLGIGEFFIKGALRGNNLVNRLINSASKELTYSENMESNMRTGSGKGMAGKDRSFTRKFFITLFADLKRKGITDLITGDMKIRTAKCKKQIKIVTVSERTCVNCGTRPVFSMSFETGIKCEKLILTLFCPGCQKQIRETAFCLPEICA